MGPCGWERGWVFFQTVHENAPTINSSIHVLSLCVCVCVCVHAVSWRQTGFAVTPTVNPGAKADSKSLRDNEIWSHLLVGLLFFSLFPSLGWDTKRWSALETKNKNKNPNWKRRIVQISRLQSATTRRYLHFPFHGAVSEFVFESLVSWQVWPCGAPPSLKTEMCFLRWGGECELSREIAC